MRTEVASNSRLVDLYSKSGDLGSYASLLALDVDHEFGFTIMAAGAKAGHQRTQLASLIAETWVAALEDAAREEASTQLTGTFVDKSQNSTLTLVVDADRPGISLKSFITRGVDFHTSLRAVMKIPAEEEVSIRLYPTGLSKGNTIGFRAVIEALPHPVDDGAFSGNCQTWVAVDSLVYGSVGLDEFEIVVDRKGNAVEVRARGFRENLTRV